MHKCINRLSLAVLTGLSAHSIVNANEVDVTANVSTSYTNYEVTTGEPEVKQKVDTFRVSPNVGFDVNTKRLGLNGNVDYQYLDRHPGGQSATDSVASNSDSYTNYRIRGELQAIENLLELTYRGNQTQRSVNASNGFISDEVFGSENLTTTTRNSVGFLFSPRRPQYLGIRVNGDYSKVNADRTISTVVGQEEIDNENVSLTTTLYQGSRIQSMYWTINSIYRDSNGRGGNGLGGNDLKSRTTQGTIGFGITNDWSIVLTGRTESNDITGQDNLTAQGLSYDSYGAGFGYSPAAGRNIEITLNQSSRLEDEEKDTFLGVNLNWAFSQRTSIAATYGRRFFGETGSFTLNHSARSLRTRIRYDENITTYSRIIEDLVSLGTFVCPSGAQGFEGCFQPDTLDYELGAGETFTDLTVALPDISEEVIIRKTLSGNVGYDFRKVSASLDFRHNQTNYLARETDLEVNSIGLNTSYKLTAKSTLSANVRYSDTDRQTEDQSDETMSYDLGFSTRIGKNFTTRVNFRYTDRDADTPDRDISERRLTWTISYLVF